MYDDAYLAPLVTPEREDRALDDVRAIAAFLPEWEDRLMVLRVYILICLESSVDSNDTFAAKLKMYREEYQHALTSARQALGAESGVASIFASVSLERG